MFIGVLLLAAVSGDWLAGGGISRGTGLTHTKVEQSVWLGAQVYPFSYQKLGLFYDFQFSNSGAFAAKPFLVKRSQKAHSLGPVFRFSLGRIQPWVGGGVRFYYESTRIKLFNELVAESGEKRTVPTVTAGSKFLVWKNLYGEAGLNLIGTARPPWQFFIGTGWRF